MTVKLRHKAQQAATVSPSGTDLQVAFATPQRALCLGCAAVFYEGPVVLGGGTPLRRGAATLLQHIRNLPATSRRYPA